MTMNLILSDINLLVTFALASFYGIAAVAMLLYHFIVRR